MSKAAARENSHAAASFDFCSFAFWNRRYLKVISCPPTVTLLI